MSREGAYGLLAIGAGPAALAAARAYREAGGPGRVALITDEHRIPYLRPALSKELLRGEIAEDEIVLEPAGWFTEQGVDLIAGRAVALDPDARTVELSGGRRLEYTRCLLATGAEPSRLAIPGADAPGVRALRSLDHLRELHRGLRSEREIVVIGSGFIGCEIAASLRALGHSVSLVTDESAPNVARLGEPAAAVIQAWLEEAGVELFFGAEVDTIEGGPNGLAVRAGETAVPGGLVVMAVGVKPRIELAALGGLPLEDGAVAADAGMRAGAPGVFAAGDVCFAENAAAGRRIRVEHWGDALTQGAVAGTNAAGGEASWREAPGFWSTIGEHTLKYSGWGEGFDEVRWEPGAEGTFAAWYGRDSRLVGVLSHGNDEAYERGQELITSGAPWR